jgi:quercetin dioxygenase-like cupin family protein
MGRFEDHRGVIEDLLQCPLDSVTEIVTLKGAVRGNHYHRKTTQWTYVVYGHLTAVARYADGTLHRELRAGDLLEEPCGVPHAWQAREDTKVLVFTQGPRSGEDYESDTTRLEDPLL